MRHSQRQSTALYRSLSPFGRDNPPRRATNPTENHPSLSYSTVLRCPHRKMCRSVNLLTLLGDFPLPTLDRAACIRGCQFSFSLLGVTVSETKVCLFNSFGTSHAPSIQIGRAHV